MKGNERQDMLVIISVEEMVELCNKRGCNLSNELVKESLCFGERQTYWNETVLNRVFKDMGKQKAALPNEIITKKWKLFETILKMCDTNELPEEFLVGQYMWST